MNNQTGRSVFVEICGYVFIDVYSIISLEKQSTVLRGAEFYRVDICTTNGEHVVMDTADWELYNWLRKIVSERDNVIINTVFKYEKESC